MRFITLFALVFVGIAAIDALHTSSPGSAIKSPSNSKAAGWSTETIKEFGQGSSPSSATPKARDVPRDQVSPAMVSDIADFINDVHRGYDIPGTAPVPDSGPARAPGRNDRAR